MINNQPLISIIVPYYNSGLFLERTFLSIQNQTYTNWELLFVDDGSSDNGPQLVSKMIAVDKRVFSLKRPNEGFKRGGRGAKNYGYTRSKGDYVVFFDSDDYMLPNYLEARIGSMQKDETIDVVFTNFGWRVHSNLIVNKVYTYNSEFNAQFSNINKSIDFWKSYADLNFSWSPSNMMWKSASIKRIKWNEDTTIGEDFEFHTQAILEGLQFKHLNKITWYYMRNESSMMLTSENPLQIERRSFYMGVVLDLLVSNKFLEVNDDLIAHFIKDQYRFIRRILSTPNSYNEKRSKINMILNRIKIMQNYFDLASSKKHWQKNLLKSYLLIFSYLIFKRGSNLFERFLIGRRKRNEVLISKIVNIKDIR